MKIKYLVIAASIAAGGLVYSCSKKSTPAPPPVHDTTVVIKIDTLVVPPPPDPTVNLKQGLMLYLPFNGNINDSSGNNNATIVAGSGTGLGTDAHGYDNHAFQSNGSGTRIKVTNNGSIKFDTALSVSMDVMISSQSDQLFLTMVDPVTGLGPSFEVGESQPGVANTDFYVNDVTAACNAVGLTGPSNPQSSTLLSFTPEVGAWYNFICIYHKGTLQTYVNGVLNSTVSTPSTALLNCSNSQVIVGAWWDGDLLSFNGKLDEVRMYSRVLTPHEITTLAQNFQVTSNKVQAKLEQGKQ